MQLYLNDGAGGFLAARGQTGLADLRAYGFGICAADHDNDGDTDAVLTTLDGAYLLENVDGVYGGRRGIPRHLGQPSLIVTNFSREMIGVYRYDGSRIFTDRALTSGIGAQSVPTLGFGLALADFDLDGDIDVFVGNGHVHHSGLPDGTEVEQPPHLFVNDGAGLFSDVVPDGGTGLSDPRLIRGVAHADYDRDGDVDLLVANNRGPLHLLRNETETETETETPGASLRVLLQGTASNRDGIGARLSVHADGHTMRHVVTSCGSYQSSSELAATFGLRPGARATVEVVWPGGTVEEIQGVTPSQQILIVEGSGKARVLNQRN